jgi:co-chaperonin GroES (HSP10)
MICLPGELPGMPHRDTILVRREKPQETTEGGIIIPDKSQKLATFGHILAAGLDALDKMYDNGIEIGDYVWFGQFASALAEWDYYESTPPDPNCPHEWSRAEGNTNWINRFQCDKCGVKRSVEAIAMMSFDDVRVSTDAERRRREGQIRIVRRQNSQGQMQHFVERAPFPVSNGTTSTMNGVEHARV